MTRLLGSELLKIRTTRAFLALFLCAFGVVLIPAILICIFGNPADGDNIDQGLSFILGGPMRAFALVMGILVVANEFRHGTITPTLLVVPNRVKLMLAKLAAALSLGGALGLLSMLAILATVAVTAAIEGLELDNHTLTVLVGGTLSTALNAGLGAAIAVLVRNQIGAVVGALIYGLLVENLLGLIPGVDEVLPQYGLGGVSTALALGTFTEDEVELIGQLPAGLLLTAYVAIFMIVGLLLMNRRDVTA